MAFALPPVPRDGPLLLACSGGLDSTVLLHRLAGEPAADAPAFSDVPADHPFATAIGWLEESGIARGYSDGRFAPAAPTTRQAMAAYLFRYDQL